MRGSGCTSWGGVGWGVLQTQLGPTAGLALTGSSAALPGPGARCRPRGSGWTEARSTRSTGRTNTEEYAEKPLKLVLRVGGKKVTELCIYSSGQDSSLFEDKNDHDKHRDRRHKKRKTGEKQFRGEVRGENTDASKRIKRSEMGTAWRRKQIEASSARPLQDLTCLLRSLWRALQPNK